MAPVILAGFGTLGGQGDAVFSGRINTAFSVGPLVRNENLLVDTFQLTFGFYPYLPDSHGAGFRFNSFNAFGAGAWDLDFQEPAVVLFE
jgi:hypothetical protein